MPSLTDENEPLVVCSTYFDLDSVSDMMNILMGTLQLNLPTPI